MCALPAEQQLRQMMTGYFVSQAIYVAAKLAIADHLANGPKTAAQLAEAVGAQPEPLYRLLRAVASVGVFSEDEAGRFELTPLAEPLRRDVPGSQRDMVLMMGEEHYHCWGALLQSVKTGERAFDAIYGMPVFEYFTANPDQGRTFDGAMTALNAQETDGMLAAYDFSPFTTLADIGGGNGSLLVAVLRQYPNLRGLLYDLPAVIERAEAKLAEAGVAERCQTVAGSFFESVPPGADAYLMRHIIHDWDDEQSKTILRNCRRAMTSDARLLIVESVIAPGNEPSFAKLLDLTMLLMPGGKERTADQFRSLLTACDLELTRIVPTDAGVSVIEATPRG